MTLTTSPSFADSLELAAGRQRQQMWQAAETVRSRFAEGEARDDMLACLGLTDVVHPDAEGHAAP